jgi:hypothetical protein
VITLQVMRINDEARVQYRQMAMILGEYPCQKDEKIYYKIISKALLLNPIYH